MKRGGRREFPSRIMHQAEKLSRLLVSSVVNASKEVLPQSGERDVSRFFHAILHTSEKRCLARG